MSAYKNGWRLEILLLLFFFRGMTNGPYGWRSKERRTMVAGSQTPKAQTGGVRKNDAPWWPGVKLLFPTANACLIKYDLEASHEHL